MRDHLNGLVCKSAPLRHGKKQGMVAHTQEAGKEKQFLDIVFEGKDSEFSRQKPESSIINSCKELKKTSLEDSSASGNRI